MEAVFRIERTMVLAALVRLVRNFDLAKGLVQDALLAALTDWPQSGIPRRASAWLLTAARRRALDRFRPVPMMERHHAEMGCKAAVLAARSRMVWVESTLLDG